MLITVVQLDWISIGITLDEKIGGRNPIADPSLSISRDSTLEA